MRILIITGIFPPDIGGPATYVPEVAKALSERHHHVTVVTLSDHTDHDDAGFAFKVVRLPRRVFKPWRWAQTLARIVNLGRDADVLFVNGLGFEASLANLWLRKPMVQKVVGDLAWEWATNHGWVQDGFEEFQKRRYALKVELLKVLRTWWTRQARTVIAPSQYLARWVSAWKVPTEKIVVIYNALEDVKAEPCTSIPLSVPLKVITVSRLIPLKRVDKVVNAVASLSLDNVGMVIVGDGPERDRLEQLVQTSGLTDRVYFAGQRSRAEVVSLMAACDVFVLNSTHEAFPHVVLEAMSLGLPVIATAVGGTPEIIHDGENGRLLPSGDDEALAKALLELLSCPPERQRMAACARRTVGQFSQCRMTTQVESVLVQSVNSAVG